MLGTSVARNGLTPQVALVPVRAVREAPALPARQTERESARDLFLALGIAVGGFVAVTYLGRRFAEWLEPA